MTKKSQQKSLPTLQQPQAKQIEKLAKQTAENYVAKSQLSSKSSQKVSFSAMTATKQKTLIQEVIAFDCIILTHESNIKTNILTFDCMSAHTRTESQPKGTETKLIRCRQLLAFQLPALSPSLSFSLSASLCLLLLSSCTGAAAVEWFFSGIGLHVCQLQRRDIR